MAKKPYVWDGSNWIELSIGMPQLAYSSASPNSPFIGQIWIDTSSSVSALNSLEFLSLASASATYLRQDTASATYIPDSIFTAKGDILAGLGLGTFNNLPVGPNNFVLTADNSASAGIKWANTQTASISNSFITYPIFNSPEERCNIVAAGASVTVNFDTLTSGIWYYTNNASANHTVNFRGNSGTTLNSLLAVGDSITTVWINTNGSTAFFPNVIQIDGSSVTPKWQGGTAPSSGNASSTDVYTFTIIKTAQTPTYVVLGSQTRFA